VVGQSLCVVWCVPMKKLSLGAETQFSEVLKRIDHGLRGGFLFAGFVCV